MMNGEWSITCEIFDYALPLAATIIIN